MNRNIDAVLWDFGGVLTSSPFEAFNRYEERHGIPRDFIRGVNATNPEANAWAKFEASRISADEFDALFEEETRRAGHSIRGRVVIEMLSGEVRPEMVAALRECKKHYRVACITNNVKSGEGPGMARSAEKAERIREVLALFDLVVESSKEGMRKPDPRIYRLACERLGVSPTRAVFLDDLGINLKPARDLGMTTIKVVNVSQALAELSKALDLTLSS